MRRQPDHINRRQLELYIYNNIIDKIPLVFIEKSRYNLLNDSTHSQNIRQRRNNESYGSSAIYTIILSDDRYSVGPIFGILSLLRI